MQVVRDGVAAVAEFLRDRAHRQTGCAQGEDLLGFVA